MSNLTADQLNVLRAINQFSPDPIASQITNGALPTDEVVAKINAYVPQGEVLFTNRLTGLKAQEASIASQITSSENILASIQAIKAELAAANPPSTN